MGCLMTIEKVSGVLLDAADADYLARAMKLLAALLEAKQGSRPSPRLVDLERRLSRASSDATRSTTGGYVSGAKDSADRDALSAYEFVDTERAANILGCTPGNVRDLARRGRLPAVRSGGRWLYPAAAVVARAERQG